MSPDRIRDEDVLRDDVGFIACMSCGERPWGYGYCGELCLSCARSEAFAANCESGADVPVQAWWPERKVCQNTLAAWLDRDWDSKRGR